MPGGDRRGFGRHGKAEFFWSEAAIMLPPNFSARSRVPDSFWCPSGTKMVPGSKQKIGGPGLSGGKTPKSQVSGYHLIPIWEWFTYIIFPPNYLSLVFLLKLFWNNLHMLYAVWPSSSSAFLSQINEICISDKKLHIKLPQNQHIT